MCDWFLFGWGSLEAAGHYIAYGKNRLSKQWLEFDDSTVTIRPPARIERQEAYVLFYQRRFRPPVMPLLTHVDEVRVRLRA